MTETETRTGTKAETANVAPSKKTAKPRKATKSKKPSKAKESSQAKTLRAVIAKIIEEAKPVKKNAKKLEDALNSMKVLEEDDLHLEMLCAQLSAMNTYINILDVRLQYLGEALAQLK